MADGNRVNSNITTISGRNYGIDIVKCLMAVWILIQHTRPWNDFPDFGFEELRSVMAAVAVSFFFVCSGYFMMPPEGTLSDEWVQVRLKIKMRKLWRLYVIWTLVYLPINIYGELAVYQSGLLKGGLHLVTGVLFRGQNYNSWPLWYLLALVVSYYLILFFGKRGFSFEQIMFLAGTFFVLGLTINFCYAQWGGAGLRFFFTVFGTQNGLFTGWCFVMLGFCLRKIKICGFLRWLVLGIGGISLACLLYRITFLASLAIMAASIGIFLFAGNLKISGNEAVQNAGKFSRVIYFSHMLFCTVFELVLNRNSGYYHRLVCVMTLLGSVLTAWFVTKNDKIFDK